MDETRFTRLESRVDEIKDDVADVKSEQKLLNHTMTNLENNIKEHTEVVKAHVAGDGKIITEIQPLIEEFKFQREKEKRRNQKLKNLGLKLGIPAGLLGLIATTLKIWTSF